MKLRIVLFAAVCLLSQHSKSQYLKVGDDARSIRFSKLMNYKSPELKVADFSGKLLVLDFWSSSCASCIESWPKLISLQKQFEKDIQIVLVNPWEDESKVGKTIERRKKVTGVQMTLPAVCGDTSILKLIAISGLPHVVWLDRNSKIFSITQGASLNASNLSAILQGNTVNMFQKEVIDYSPVDMQKPLFVDGNGGEPIAPVEYSMLTRYNKNLRPGFGIFPGTDPSCILASNGDILGMYGNAFSERRNPDGVLLELLRNRISLELKDTSKYVYRINGELQPQNLYVYQLIVAKASLSELLALMRSDLSRYFGLKARWEKRKRKCFILRIADSSLIAYKNGPRIIEVRDSIKLNRVKASDLVYAMESELSFYYNHPFPIVDETGYSGLLGNIVISGNIEDPDSFNKALSKYRMSFSVEERELDVLVISE